MKKTLILILLFSMFGCASHVQSNDNNIISRAELQKIVKKELGCTIIAMDNYFQVLPYSSIKNMLVVDDSEYIAEFNDCDDKAIRMMSGVFSKYCCGLLSVNMKDGQSHMITIFIDSDKKIRLYDQLLNRFVDKSQYKDVLYAIFA